MTDTDPSPQPSSLLSLGWSDRPLPPTVGYWPRALARTIDTVLHNFFGFVGVFVGASAAAIVTTLHGRDTTELLARTQRTSVPLFIVLVIGSIAYHSLLEGLHGSTLGKRICGLVTVSEGQVPCSLPQALGRSAAFFVDSLFFTVPAAASMSNSPLKQRLGDRWAGTVVMHRADAPPSAIRSGTRLFVVALAAVASDTLLAALAYFTWLLA